MKIISSLKLRLIIITWFFCLIPITHAIDNETILPRIIRGQPVSNNTYPWMAKLSIRNSQGNGVGCGATLIHPYWAMTAAHCFTNDTEDAIDTTSTHNAVVILGRTTLSDSAQGEVINVKQVVIHPHFDPSRTSPNPNDFDMALIELETDSKQTPVILLSKNTPDIAAGTLVTVMGWGATAVNKMGDGINAANTLMQVAVPVISNVTCNSVFLNEITDNMVCAGFAEGGKDSCQGDSGGPLIIPNTNAWVQIGIVSFGRVCAKAPAYGVYTRVSSFNDFIMQTIPEIKFAEFGTQGKGVDNQGNSITTHARFNVKIETLTGTVAIKGMVSQTDQIAVKSTIFVDPVHVGKNADIVMAIFYNQASFMRFGDNWVTWDGRISSIQPALSTVNLPIQLNDITLFSGQLTGLVGRFTVYIGYKLADGSVIFNGVEPLVFEVFS